jgi:NitT/TauT family transport system ATP-binding protein
MTAAPALRTETTLCEVRDVSHDFKLPNGQPLRVLENISLAVCREEVVALLGPSGCGKSTILRIIAGLIRPTKGEVLCRGLRLQGLNPGVAVVFQGFALFPWMTVTENVETVLRAAGRSRAEIQAQVQRVVRLVGLNGFEDAYPRELSGGMKQRVGMARALAVDPEILLMDEPFSQVDALTAESLRAEVLDIWAGPHRNPSAILMVSHDIKEVAYMADRIVILSANPGRVRTVVANRLPRPRDYRSPEFAALVDQLHDIITGHELPDVPAPAAGAAQIEPLPAVGAGEVVGLLEYLDARRGRNDIFRIAEDTHREFGHVIAIAKAAEMLDLVDTPKHQVVLTPVGMQFVKAGPDERKGLWRQQVLKLHLFREVFDLLKRQEDHAIDKEFVQEQIVLRMPYENYETVFETFVRWGRYADLFTYDEDAEKLRLEEEPSAAS